MYKEKILDLQTGEETWRDYSDEEIAKVEAAQAEAAKRIEKEQEITAAKKALLEKLGLTEDEAKLLLS